MRHFRFEFLLVFAIVLFAWLAPQAHAARLFVGQESRYHPLCEVAGTDLVLSHKVTLTFFILGIFTSDDGYVLQKAGTPEKCVPLSEFKIREFQSAGYLPRPLPDYSISLTDYLLGYSLWIFVALCFIVPPAYRKVFPRYGRQFRLIDEPRYQRAIQIALDPSEQGGLDNAVAYLNSQGVSTSRALANIQRMLSEGDLEYRLKCNCARFVTVDERSAGTSMYCECGRQLHVPPLEKFSTLSRVYVPP